MSSVLDRKQNESEYEYRIRICSLKDVYNYNWADVANFLNDKLGYNYSADKYRKEYYKFCKENNDDSNFIDEHAQDEIVSERVSIRKEKYKLQEERTQINGMIRAMSREETLKEIALDLVQYMSGIKILDLPGSIKLAKKNDNNENKGILVISDWHYGVDVETYYNIYNPDIARGRVSLLLSKSLELIEKEGIKEIFLVNLGDMISGIIHLPLRLNSREDVISQTISVSEILSEFITELSRSCIVNYASVTDNHSRLDPNKKESLQLESFTRIIDWYLKSRLENNKNVKFIENEYGDDICSFNIFDFKVLGVHGDKDPKSKIITQLISFTQEHYDMILSAHHHHFYAEERNETELYSNGSLMGTDDYANSLRLNSKPSQLFIVADKDNISKCIYKIKL